MPTLKPTLTLVSTLGTAGVSENATLALSVTDELTVTDPTIGISKIACDVTGANTIILPSLDVTRYVYIKNTGIDGADQPIAAGVTIKVETADGARVIDVAEDEFCFFPHHAEAAGLIQLEASAGTVIAEYGYWTKG